LQGSEVEGAGLRQPTFSQRLAQLREHALGKVIYFRLANNEVVALALRAVLRYEVLATTTVSTDRHDAGQ
jgi:hypothetical protein